MRRHLPRRQERQERLRLIEEWRINGSNWLTANVSRVERKSMKIKIGVIAIVAGLVGTLVFSQSQRTAAMLAKFVNPTCIRSFGRRLFRLETARLRSSSWTVARKYWISRLAEKQGSNRILNSLKSTDVVGTGKSAPRHVRVRPDTF